MSERYASELERALADGLEPVAAPASLWYRVDAELSGRRRRRAFPRFALALGVMLVAVVSMGWYLDRPAPAGASSNRPVQVVRGEHSCVRCHV
jgi:hypothetical protein